MLRLLVINPGSTSTKIAVYEDEQQLFQASLRHTAEEISQYATIPDQYVFRRNAILDMLKAKAFDLCTLDAVVGRGGLLKPIISGTYRVNAAMLKDLQAGIQGQHASNLGGIIAHEIGESLGIPAFITDPVVVDEMEDVARISGLPEIQRKSIFHALNQKAVARRYAADMGKPYAALNLIVAHMGGGVSVGVHQNGRVIDVNNALDGEGPLSTERSGGVPVGDLVRLCYSGQFTLEEMLKKISGRGGLVAYLNTNDFQEVCSRVEKGDSNAQLLFQVFIYQTAKEIAASAAVLFGKVDAILLTGGIAFAKNAVEAITERVGFVAPVVVYPGEDELMALALGGLSVLKGEQEEKVYQ